MIYTSIDIETTGLDENRDQILSVGMVVDDLTNPQPFEKSPRVEFVSLVDRIWGNPIAIEMNAGLLREIREGTDYPDRVYVDPDRLMWSVENWLQENVGDKVNVAGKCFSTFDDLFLAANSETWRKLRRRRILDPSILFATLEDEALPNLPTCLERAGLGEPTNYHNALGDAWDVCRLIRTHFNVPVEAQPAVG